jgi:hypothetical protein
MGCRDPSNRLAIRKFGLDDVAKGVDDVVSEEPRWPVYRSFFTGRRMSRRLPVRPLLDHWLKLEAPYDVQRSLNDMARLSQSRKSSDAMRVSCALKGWKAK